MTNEEHKDSFEENQNRETQDMPVHEPLETIESFRKRVDVSKVEDIYHKVNLELKKVIIGQQDLIDQLLLGLLSGGHVLVEGVPGIAKTLTAKLMARTLDIDFSRIQFTPDLMPSDVLGTNVFNLKTSEFSFNKGPVFSNIILIDEINRSPAKTQAALFEVMEEYQITVDGTTYPLDLPFFVMATQNPIEQEGTYKLPEAQLDRFIFKINIGHPSLEEEKAILKRFKNDFNLDAAKEVKAVFKAKDILEAREVVEKVHIEESLLDYIASLVYQTRTSGDLYLGASPRASIALMKASKAMAAMNGRDYVIPEDIRYVSHPVLNHRILLTPEREMEGVDVGQVIDELIKLVEVPR